MRPIFLLSDFGHRDIYVGVMKARIQSLAPGAATIDLCHEIEPQNIRMGSIFLQDAWDWLPEDAIVVAVVDPGVGTSRHPIAISLKNRFLIAPDNGLVTSIYPVNNRADIHLLPYPIDSSSTFHGRDVFAPAAASLAIHSQNALKTFPRHFEDPVLLKPLRNQRITETDFQVPVLYADHFGNLITNWKREHSDRIEVLIGEKSIPLVKTYAELMPQQLGALFGSSDRLEIACRDASAQKRLPNLMEVQLRLF